MSNGCIHVTKHETRLLPDDQHFHLNKNSTTGADASGELMQLAEELANCNAVVCS